MDERLHELSRRAAEETACTNDAANTPDGETGAKTKSIRFKVSAYDPRSIEQWLSERAAEGKLLLRGDDFVIGAPCECRYHLEPALDDDDPNERTRETRADGLGVRLPDEGRHFLHLAR